jgi:TgpA N-terminal domain/Transglutaminase-like superfamily
VTEEGYARVAIPITTAGAVWSWYRRQYSKHWLNVGMSVAVLAILIVGIFPILFKELEVGNSAPTAIRGTISIALGLQTILVDLQLGLSFNLYGRKVLGYGVVISSLLMAIAAYLSQSISFLILLCGFVAIAIPILMLDYRSRIALKPIGISATPTLELLPYQHLPWKYLGRLAAISLGIGLMVAVFLPNFRFSNLSLPNIQQNPQIASQGAINAEQMERGTLNQPDRSASAPSSMTPPSQSVGSMAAQLLGQPGNNNYPDSIRQKNLQLPPEISSQLQQFTQKILATSPQPLDSDYARSAYIAEYLKQHHQADLQSTDLTNLPPVDAKAIAKVIAKCPPNSTDCPIVANKQDLPILYTSMLRSIGIPTRLKTGDRPLEIDPQTQMYPRPPASEPSKTEVYFPNWGWFGLDATPDRPLLNPDPTQLAQLQQQVKIMPLTFPDPATNPQTTPNPAPSGSSPTANSQATPSPDPTTPSPSSKPASNSPFSNLSSFFQPNRATSTPSSASSPAPPKLDLPKWEPNPAILKLVVIIIAIGVGIYLYLAHQRRHKQEQQMLASLPPVERIYRSMLTSLSKNKLSKLPSQTQIEYAGIAQKTVHPQIAKVVWEISSAYIAWRYGKQKPNIKELEKKLQFLQHLQKLAADRERQQKIANFRSQWGFK